jgi:alkaline phosphatase D
VNNQSLAQRFLALSRPPFFGLFFSVLLAAGCATLDSTPEFNTRNGLPIVQGLTNESATQFAIVSTVGLKLTFNVEAVSEEKPKPSASNPVNAGMLVTSTRTSAGSKVVVHHLQVGGLQLGQLYLLKVRDQYDQIVDQRSFRTLDTSPHPVRVLTASCLYDYFLAESRVMWKAALDAKPDMIMLIGDNVYAEISNGRFKSPLDESALWTRYSETFFALDFYKARTLVPTIVTWDDHDYGMKDGNRENPHQAESKKVMQSFFAQEPSSAYPQFETGPGVSSKFDAFGYRFLLLDDRSFRTPKQADPNSFDPALPAQTHFGSGQEEWIFSNVKSSPFPVWLISGDQWFGGYHKFESYEGTHPLSFKPFLKKLYGSHQPIFFLSGDRHLSEVSRVEKELLGFETYEFTSSSIHSKAHPSKWDTNPNPRHVMGVEMKHNFVVFDLTPMKKDGTVHLHGSSMGAESTTYYTFDFDVRGASPTKRR